MPITRKLSSFLKILSLAAPLTLATGVHAATLSANCAANYAIGSPSASPNCMSATSEGHVSTYLQYFNNGFTVSLFANGTSWPSASQAGSFSLNAELPVNIHIAGPSRELVVYKDVDQTETLRTSAGTTGEVLYGFSHFAVITRHPDGGGPLCFDFEYSPETRVLNWNSADLSNFNLGLSMQLSGSITSGNLFASMSSSSMYRFYEADGVTPVELLVSQTPEPASIWLLLGSLPACLFAIRRRKASERSDA
jgi:hypothetical protein